MTKQGPGVGLKWIEGACSHISHAFTSSESHPVALTFRYAANFLVNLKWRDESWWSSTMTALRSTAAHLPRHLAQQMALERANNGLRAAAAVSASMHTQQAMDHSHGNNHQNQRSEQQVGSRGGRIDTAATAAAGSSGAVLRAAREDAELSSRADCQAAAPPTTIDGFKAHPLYVLLRHITKYQVSSVLHCDVA